MPNEVLVVRAGVAPGPPQPERWTRAAAATIAGVPARSYVRRVLDGDLCVIITRDPHHRLHGVVLWHLSISHATRYPTWDEIAEARYDLLPDEVTMAMLLPPRAEYVNVHPNCFHLHEIHA